MKCLIFNYIGWFYRFRGSCNYELKPKANHCREWLKHKLKWEVWFWATDLKWQLFYPQLHQVRQWPPQLQLGHPPAVSLRAVLTCLQVVRWWPLLIKLMLTTILYLPPPVRWASGNQLKQRTCHPMKSSLLRKGHGLTPPHRLTSLASHTILWSLIRPTHHNKPGSQAVAFKLAMLLLHCKTRGLQYHRETNYSIIINYMRRANMSIVQSLEDHHHRGYLPNKPIQLVSLSTLLGQLHRSLCKPKPKKWGNQRECTCITNCLQMNGIFSVVVSSYHQPTNRSTPKKWGYHLRLSEHHPGCATSVCLWKLWVESLKRVERRLSHRVFLHTCQIEWLTCERASEQRPMSNLFFCKDFEFFFSSSFKCKPNCKKGLVALLYRRCSRWWATLFIVLWSCLVPIFFECQFWVDVAWLCLSFTPTLEICFVLIELRLKEVSCLSFRKLTFQWRDYCRCWRPNKCDVHFLR